MIFANTGRSNASDVPTVSCRSLLNFWHAERAGQVGGRQARGIFFDPSVQNKRSLHSQLEIGRLAGGRAEQFGIG